MVSQSVALSTTQDYVAAVRSFGVNIRHAYLFGSYAKNNPHEWSDIDVALVADDFVGFVPFDTERFRRLQTLPKFMDIEAHTFSTAQLADPDPFFREILKTGIEIN